jgi:two-component system, NarL family, nitrate/nitrite response regulator NarL
MEPADRRSSPAPREELAPIASGRDLVPTGPPIRILFVSDLLLMRAALSRLLDALEIGQISQASSRQEALALIASERPDIILVDLDSRSDALVCVRELASAADRTRIIVLTDRARAADEAALIELGAAGVVQKLEQPEVLIKAIRKVHAGEIWLDRTTTAHVLVGAARRRRAEDLERAKIATLTRREREIITLIGEGLKNRLIAGRLFISEATVRNHLTSILDKLGLSDRFELAVYAYKVGLVRSPDLSHVDWVKSA